jgi:uncharacterized protein YjaG (DUF416 family)
MRDDIEQLIHHLSDRQKAAFAGFTCEKLYPQYVAFCQAANWGSPVVFERGVALLFQAAQQDIPADIVRAWLERLEQVAPDAAKFQVALAPYALDACIALEQALLFLLNKQEAYLLYSTTAATDAVDMFVQESLDLDPNQRNLDAVIDASPFMQRELARQRRVAEALLSLWELDDEQIAELRQFNGTEGIIDLSLLESS